MYDAFDPTCRPQRGRGQLSRRDIITSTLGAFGLAALGPIGNLPAASLRRGSAVPAAGQKFLVVLELDGGNDGLNMVVPVTVGNYLTRRPTIGLTAGETLALDSGPFATSEFRLHPRLPNLAQMYIGGELAIVSKVGYPNANQSHDTSKNIWSSGIRSNPDMASGWIARYADSQAPTTLGAVSLRRGRHRALIGGNTNPLMMNTLAAFRYDVDTAFTANHNRRMAIIRDMLEAQQSSATRDALLTGHALADQIAAAVSGYTGTANYGNSGIGSAMRDIARMLEAGFETRIFYTGYGGFDTHAGQGKLTGAHPDLLRSLDESLKGFSDDCKAMGIWQNCLVVVISEFGRRNFENGSAGTDHGGANVVLVAGGAINGGLHGVGPTDADIDRSILPHSVDFRALYANILADHLGMSNPNSVFLEPYQSPNPVDVV